MQILQDPKAYAASAAASFSRGVPLVALFEAAKLHREFIESVKAQQRLLARLERLTPAVKAVA